MTTTKNTPLIGGLVIVLVLASIVWYAASKPMPAQAPTTATGTTTASASLPEMSPYTENAAYYDVAANYPTTTPLSASADVAARAEMRTWIASQIAQFKSDGNFDSLTQNDIHMMGYDQGRKETLQFTYLIASSEHTVSYIYTEYLDTLGAHGNMFFKTFVFDKNSGALLSLSDVFAPGTDYLSLLSQMARSRLPGVIGDGYDYTAIKDGTAPDEKNFDNWFFDGADFVVLFPPYQVAAYSAGPQTLRIATSELLGKLTTQYP